MIIEKNGVTPPLTFKEINGGECFYIKGDYTGPLLMKGFQFQGIGHCAVNLRNGAVSTAKPDTEVFRTNAKVVLE